MGSHLGPLSGKVHKGFTSKTLRNRGISVQGWSKRGPNMVILGPLLGPPLAGCRLGLRLKPLEIGVFPSRGGQKGVHFGTHFGTLFDPLWPKRGHFTLGFSYIPSQEGSQRGSQNGPQNDPWDPFLTPFDHPWAVSPQWLREIWALRSGVDLGVPDMTPWDPFLTLLSTPGSVSPQQLRGIWPLRSGVLPGMAPGTLPGVRI